MEDTQGSAEKRDMIDRKGAWIERMFDRLFAAIGSNPTAAFCVLSFGLNIWQFNINTQINELRLSDNDKANDKINAAVEKYVNRMLPEKLAPYEAKQDSISKNVDTSLLNLDGTVEIVKKYFNKKKR
jgi:hypothetical protein